VAAMSLAATGSGRLWLRRGKQKIGCPAKLATWEGGVADQSPCPFAVPALCPQRPAILGMCPIKLHKLIRGRLSLKR
jgi:hypothetical protein